MSCNHTFLILAEQHFEKKFSHPKTNLQENKVWQIYFQVGEKFSNWFG